LGFCRCVPTCPPRTPHGASLSLETVAHLRLLLDTPSRVPGNPCRSQLALVLQVGALAPSVSGSLRRGPGTGLAPAGAHLRSPGHASHTSGRHPGYPGHLPRNRTCAVRIRLFGTAGCHPRRRPVYDLVVPSGSVNCAGALMAAQIGPKRSSSVIKPRSAKYAFRSARCTTASWLSAQKDLRPP
jgi:hypothetical protein